MTKVEYYERRIAEMQNKILEYQMEISDLQQSCTHSDRSEGPMEDDWAGESYVYRYNCPDCKLSWTEPLSRKGI